MYFDLSFDWNKLPEEIVNIGETCHHHTFQKSINQPIKQIHADFQHSARCSKVEWCRLYQQKQKWQVLLRKRNFNFLALVYHTCSFHPNIIIEIQILVHIDVCSTHSTTKRFVCVCVCCRCVVMTIGISGLSSECSALWKKYKWRPWEQIFKFDWSTEISESPGKTDKQAKK